MAIAEAVVERTLAEADLDNDGALSLEEFSAYLGGQPTLLRSMLDSIQLNARRSAAESWC